MMEIHAEPFKEGGRKYVKLPQGEFTQIMELLEDAENGRGASPSDGSAAVEVTRQRYPAPRPGSSQLVPPRGQPVPRAWSRDDRRASLTRSTRN